MLNDLFPVKFCEEETHATVNFISDEQSKYIMQAFSQKQLTL